MTHYSFNKSDNYYELFSVNAKASQEEIRQAYRNKLKKWHPDKNPAQVKEAEEITKVLNNAYHILRDPGRRKNYNRMLRFTKGKDFEKHISDEAFSDKIKKASSVFRQILENVREIYSLFKDAIKGRYKLHPLTLGIISAGLLYFIMPIDFIPDFIPAIGLLDDVAILTSIINSIQGELIDYRKWKENMGKDQD
jgi:curved DNA-binding protein CbpA